jgi:hypothetical protein
LDEVVALDNEIGDLDNQKVEDNVDEDETDE